MQWEPLVCPTCGCSAYDLDTSQSRQARTITAGMLRRTDDKALEPQEVLALECPYCSNPLAIPKTYPVIGSGGFEVRFVWVTMSAITK